MTQIEFNTSIGTHCSFLRSRALQFTKDSEEADDLVQETMLKAIRYYNQYKEGSNLRGWLFTILRNSFLNHYKHLMVVKKIISSSEDISEYSLNSTSASNSCYSKFIVDDINKVINKLPKQYKTPFNMYFEGYKYHEIAEAANMPVGTVKTNIHIARKILKKALKPYGEKASVSGVV